MDSYTFCLSHDFHRLEFHLSCRKAVGKGNGLESLTLIKDISPTDLTDTFGHIFSDKIMKIRAKLQSLEPVSVTRPRTNNRALSSFEQPVCQDDILKILKSSPTKSYDLDPIPTSLVKELVDILVTPIANPTSVSYLN